MRFFTAFWNATVQKLLYSTIEISDSNCRARLSRSKQVLKYASSEVASFLSLRITYSRLPKQETHRLSVCTHLQQPRRKTLRQNAFGHDHCSSSRWWSTGVLKFGFTNVSIPVKVTGAYLRNLLLLQHLFPPYVRSLAGYLSTAQCPGIQDRSARYIQLFCS